MVAFPPPPPPHFSLDMEQAITTRWLANPNIKAVACHFRHKQSEHHLVHNQSEDSRVHWTVLQVSWTLFTVEVRMVIIFWTHNAISFKHTNVWLVSGFGSPLYRIPLKCRVSYQEKVIEEGLSILYRRTSLRIEVVAKGRLIVVMVECMDIGTMLL